MVLQALVLDVDDGPHPGAGAVDGFVVDDDELPIGRALDVEFDPVGSHGDGLLERGKGVLWRVCTRSTVGPVLCHAHIQALVGQLGVKAV